MEKETIQSMMRRKVLELKTDMPGFYTETYNLVSTLIRLTPADTELVDLVQEKISWLYSRPSHKHKMSLAHFEDLYMKYKGDTTFKVRKNKKLDIYEIKRVLDKVRRDLLFYLAIVESPTKNYDIQVGKIKKKIDTDATPAPPSTGTAGSSEARRKDNERGQSL